VLDLLAHPASDQPEVASTIERLKGSIARLEHLERHYDENMATVHRKRSQQSSFNLRERAKSFTSFEDERPGVVMEARAASAPMQVELRFDPAAISLAAVQKWRDWGVLPIEVTDTSVTVAMEDPRDGFLISEIETEVGRRVHTVYSGVSPEQLRAMLPRT
jgi:hypothetical protein